MAQPSIFVQIASYRDPECQWTIRDMFEKAKYPERVFPGICWQYHPAEDQHCFEIPNPKPENTLTLLCHYSRSQGVCWARHMAQQLYQNEDYVLMIDSHMRFAPNWDEKMIEQLAQCESEKPILTTYPASYTPPNNIPEKAHPTYMHAKPFKAHSLRFKADCLMETPKKPLKGAFLAAGFLFTKGQFVKEVPYDPYMYFAYEESSMAVRAFTHGWETFSPTETLIYHYYNVDQNASDKKMHWDDHEDWNVTSTRSRHRNYYLMCGDEPKDKSVLIDIKKYGLGKVKTVKDFEKLTGINFKTRTVTEKALKGLFIPHIMKYKPIFVERKFEGGEQKKQ